MTLAWTCPSCGTASSAGYCPACGEVRPGIRNAPARSFVARLRASLNALASPPGRLTRDWIEGRRVRYLAPVPLFLYTNVAFFLVQWASGVSILSWPLNIHLANDILGVPARLAAWYPGMNAIKNPQTVAVFNALEVVHAKALVIVMLPLFALPLLAVRIEGRRSFANAFAFSAHFFTFALIMLSAMFPLVSLSLRGLAAVGVRPSPSAIDYSVGVLEVVFVAAYLARALDGLTAMRAWWRWLFATILLVLLFFVLSLYHVIVFATTLMSL